MTTHPSRTHQANYSKPPTTAKRLSLLQREADPPSLTHPTLQLQQQIGNRAVGSLLQAKLTIGQPNDPYEKEADRIAAQVVDRIHPPALQPQTLDEDEKTLQAKPHPIQRQPDDGELQMQPQVQWHPNGSGVTSDTLATTIQTARGHGQPLSPSIQTSMSQAFGADFSQVKIHTDSQAHQLNQSIQARAFTTGQDIFFRRGEYQPHTRPGQTLLAHELTHVVQQNRLPKALIKNSISLQKRVDICTFPRQEDDIKSSGKQEIIHQATQDVINRSPDDSNRPPTFVLRFYLAKADIIMGSGFLDIWLSRVSEFEDLGHEVSSLIKVIPESQGWALLAKYIRVDHVFKHSQQSLLDIALLAENSDRNPASELSATDHALEAQYNFTQNIHDLSLSVEKLNYLLRAKVFDFFADYGQSVLREAASVAKELEAVAYVVKTLQKKIHDLPGHIAEAFLQLGINVVLNGTLLAFPVAGVPLKIALSAGSTFSSIYIDSLLGPDSTEPFSVSMSNLVSFRASSEGVAEALSKGNQELANSSRLWSKISFVASFGSDILEINQAIENYNLMESMINKLSQLKSKHYRLRERYKVLSPLLGNYDLAIRIINGARQSAIDNSRLAD